MQTADLEQDADELASPSTHEEKEAAAEHYKKDNRRLGSEYNIFLLILKLVFRVILDLL